MILANLWERALVAIEETNTNSPVDSRPALRRQTSPKN